MMPRGTEGLPFSRAPFNKGVFPGCRCVSLASTTSHACVCGVIVTGSENGALHNFLGLIRTQSLKLSRRTTQYETDQVVEQKFFLGGQKEDGRWIFYRQSQNARFKNSR